MNDDITRLADIMAKEIKNAGPDGDIEVRKVEYWESVLRALARTGHVEDKLGMVAEGWRNRIVSIERNSEYDTGLRTDTPILILRFASVSLRESANPLAKGWVDRGLVAAMLAAAPTPDHSAGVVMAAVSEKSRQLIVAFMRDCNSIGTIGAAENLGEGIKEFADNFDPAEAQTAALAQPADADEEGGR